MMPIAIRVALSLALTGLVGCSSVQAASGGVPSSCDQPTVINAFGERVDGAKYIPTEWQPGEGTDLAAAINAGGIACSYGIEEAEVGGTVLWAPAEDGLWESRVEGWKAAGQTAVDLAGIDESAAYILEEGVGSDERHLWSVNMLIDGVWVHLSATFLRDTDQAIDLLKAIASATR